MFGQNNPRAAIPSPSRLRETGRRVLCTRRRWTGRTSAKSQVRWRCLRAKRWRPCSLITLLESRPSHREGLGQGPGEVQEAWWNDTCAREENRLLGSRFCYRLLPLPTITHFPDLVSASVFAAS